MKIKDIAFATILVALIVGMLTLSIFFGAQERSYADDGMRSYNIAFQDIRARVTLNQAQLDLALKKGLKKTFSIWTGADYSWPGTKADFDKLITPPAPPVSNVTIAIPQLKLDESHFLAGELQGMLSISDLKTGATKFCRVNIKLEVVQQPAEATHASNRN